MFLNFLILIPFHLFLFLIKTIKLSGGKRKRYAGHGLWVAHAFCGATFVGHSVLSFAYSQPLKTSASKRNSHRLSNNINFSFIR
jgi:hypothetical protein